MNLILCEPGEIDASGEVALTGVRAAHLRDVLRVGPGDRVWIGVVDGPKGVGEVLTIAEGTARLRCALDPDAPPVPPVDLVLALPRPKVLRRLWAQLAALGVGRVYLTNAWKVERHYFDAHVLDEGVYRPLLVEGLQQAGDTRLPRVTMHRQFRPLIEDEIGMAPGGDLRLVADPAADRAISAIARERSRGRVTLAIGPEGGWNAFELDLLARHGFAGVGLGPRTLRTDTACVALLALLHEALRERVSSGGAP